MDSSIEIQRFSETRARVDKFPHTHKHNIYFHRTVLSSTQSSLHRSYQRPMIITSKCQQLLLFICTLCLVSTSLAAQCLTGNDSPESTNEDARNNLIDGRLGFALDSLKIVSEINTEDNIFYSPHSLHEALLLVYLGARGTTETSLRKALHIPSNLSKIDVQKFHAFENALEETRKDVNPTTPLSNDRYEFSVANRLWIKNTTKLRKCMLSLFDREIERIDFRSNPEAARNQINQWVSNITRGNIQDLIPLQGIAQDTDLVLTNAVYFKGLWKSQFNPNSTKKSIFYQTQNNATLVNFMHQKGTFNHMVSEELGAHVLQLPYKGDEVSMFIFLPPFANTARQYRGRSDDSVVAKGNNSNENGASNDTQDGLIQLIQRISSTESGLKELHEILDEGMQAKSVQVKIPKFTLERELPILQVAQALGIDEIFKPNVADLREFVEDDEESLHIGDAVHRAKIEITEEGTTAAAATALFSFRSSRPSGPAIFNANHPFLYIIYDHPNRSILFNGIFRKPMKFDSAPSDKI